MGPGAVAEKAVAVELALEAVAVASVSPGAEEVAVVLRGAEGVGLVLLWVLSRTTWRGETREYFMLATALTTSPMRTFTPTMPHLEEARSKKLFGARPMEPSKGSAT
eukprot:RCo036560